MKYLFKVLSLIITSQLLIACQIPYLLKNSWHQTKILKSRIPIEKILNDPSIPNSTKKKLQLVEKAKVFSENQLGLQVTDNYTSYVDLKRPYVTWVVRGAAQFELKPHLWWFPITGNVPYKGYFTKKDAEAEELKLKRRGLDTLVRGVTAYSTLGWFNDPVLNTMMNYSDYQLVNLIIHETVHATVFIKSNVDFNERLASFIASKGAEEFFGSSESGKEILQKARQIDYDYEVFSQFISEEVNSLEKFYLEKKDSMTLEKKDARLIEIQNRFQKNIAPKMKSNYFSAFHKKKLNNARLLSYSTYQSNFKIFNDVFLTFNKDIPQFIEFFKKIEKSKNPEADMKEYLKKVTSY